MRYDEFGNDTPFIRFMGCIAVAQNYGLDLRVSLQELILKHSMPNLDISHHPSTANMNEE